MESLTSPTPCRGGLRTAQRRTALDRTRRSRTAGLMPGEPQCGRAWANVFGYPWIPAFAGMTGGGRRASWGMPVRNAWLRAVAYLPHYSWIPAFAGMTREERACMVRKLHVLRPGKKALLPECTWHQSSGVRISRDGNANPKPDGVTASPSSRHPVRDAGTVWPYTPSFSRKRESTVTHKWSMPDACSLMPDAFFWPDPA
jgi:hypothetical protein